MSNKSAGLSRLTILQLLITIVLITGLAGCKQPSLIKEWRDSSDLKSKAETGDVQSQYLLAMNYTHGHGVIQNHETAVKWFQKAAQAGHLDSQFMLGAALTSGRGIKQDRGQAIHWLTKSAEAGHMRSQYQLGDAYVNGVGVTRDHAWGARWYGMSASQGHKQAQFYLGALYSKGIGLPRSLPKAVFWLRRAELAENIHAAKALSHLKKQFSEKHYAASISKADRWTPATKMAGLNNRPTLIYIQHVLNQMNYSAGFPDGIRGLKTDSAISRYQLDKGLPPSRSLEPIVTRLRQDSSKMDKL